MKMINNIREFLEDKKYYIDIYDNKLHIFNYKKLIKLSDTEMIIEIENFLLKINGINLKIIQMEKQELLIVGSVENMRFN